MVIKIDKAILEFTLSIYRQLEKKKDTLPDEDFESKYIEEFERILHIHRGIM